MSGKLRLKDAKSYALFVIGNKKNRVLEDDDHPNVVLQSWGEGCRLVFKKRIFSKVDYELNESTDDRHMLYIQVMSTPITITSFMQTNNNINLPLYFIFLLS